MCDLRAALSLAPGSPLRCGGFRRRQRLFVRSSGGALAHARLAALCFRSRPARRFAAAVSGGSKDFLCDLRCGALAHARFASSGGGFRRQRLFARPFGGALAPLGSPLRCGAPAPPGSPPAVFGGALAPLGSPLPAAAKTFCATFGRRSRSHPVRRPLFSAALPLTLGSPPLVRRFPAGAKTFCATFGAALSVFGGGKDSLCDFSVRRSRSARFAPSVFGGALAHARFAASGRRFPAAAKTLCATFRRRSRSARFAARAQSRAKKTPALFFEHGRLLPHNFARFR